MAEMLYKYASVWALEGGVNLNLEDAEVEIAKVPSGRFVVSRNSELLFEHAELGTAVAHVMLRGLIGNSEAASVLPRVQSALLEVQSARRKKLGNKVFLAFEAFGQLEVDTDSQIKELESFSVGFGLYDRGAVKLQHRALIESMQTALAVLSPYPPKFSNVLDSVIAFRNDGRPIFSVELRASAELSVSQPFNERQAQEIASAFQEVLGAIEFESVVRLTAQLLSNKQDRLLSFLSGWAGLERLIAKLFNTIEPELDTLDAAKNHPKLHEELVKLRSNGRPDKFSIAQKCLVVSMRLFEAKSSVLAIESFKLFSDVKKSRDAIYHGDDFDVADLPETEVLELIRTYIKAWLKFQSRRKCNDSMEFK
ncbi:MAG: hypothetical protein SF172_11200 [Burkholderiales bacterium]|nr:hypothetical protein [Burkholderiales bacterium]